jgi:hypothetical protein
MGCDGGSIPRRSELVKTKERESGDAKKDGQVKNNRWRYCALSNEPLKSPIVACLKYGRLYNKESILKLLIDRSSDALLYPDINSCTHIKSLKDVKTLDATPNPYFREGDSCASPFVCPVTGKEMNGNFKFVYLRGCGCLMAEAALKKVKSETCMKCGKQRKENDAIYIYDEKTVDEDTKLKKRKASVDGTNESFDQLRAAVGGIASLRKTKAVDSLYAKGVHKAGATGNLYAGTFNRYAA